MSYTLRVELMPPGSASEPGRVFAPADVARLQNRLVIAMARLRSSHSLPPTSSVLIELNQDNPEIHITVALEDSWNEDGIKDFLRDLIRGSRNRVRGSMFVYRLDSPWEPFFTCPIVPEGLVWTQRVEPPPVAVSAREPFPETT